MPSELLLYQRTAVLSSQRCSAAVLELVPGRRPCPALPRFLLSPPGDAETCATAGTGTKLCWCWLGRGEKRMRVRENREKHKINNMGVSGRRFWSIFQDHWSATAALNPAHTLQAHRRRVAGAEGPSDGVGEDNCSDSGAEESKWISNWPGPSERPSEDVLPSVPFSLMRLLPSRIT